MATAPSPEASEIRRRGRRRLLGAVTLVMALVVFVPMILDSEPRPPRSEPSPAIPPKENATPLPVPSPAPTPVEAPAAAPSPSRPPHGGNGPGPNVPAQAPDKAPISASGEVLPPSSSQAPQADNASSSRAPQGGNGPGSNSTSTSPRLEGFAVQVGAFREEERLKQARAKLEAAHVPHYTERVAGSGGPITRLRAGPFPTREAAEAARAKLNDGKVVPLP